MADLPVFISPRFWLMFSGAVLAFVILLAARRDRLRLLLFPLLQLAVLHFGLQMPWATLGIIVAFFSAVYGAVRWSQMFWPPLFIILALLFGREILFAKLSAEPRIVLLLAVGLSYSCLRLFSFLVDWSAGKFEKPDFLDYLSYLLFVPAFVAGPIDRFPRFAQDVRHPLSLSLEGATMALRRITAGLVKKLLLAPWLTAHALTADAAGMSNGAAHPWSALYAYAALIYVDFSGYSDLAVGSARFLGVQIPENFNWPYLKTNLIDFWNSWHMSLSSWLRDYIFFPTGQRLFKWDALSAHPLFIGTLGYIVTMAFCGLWHSASMHFLVWGLYHGIGLSICKSFRFWTTRHSPEWFQRFQPSWPGRLVNGLLTFHFVTFGWIFFVLDLDKASLFLRRVWNGI